MAVISRTYGKILAVLMAWLGYSCNIFNPAEEYGTPSATFKAKGTVISQENDVPIEGIRAVLKVPWDSTNEHFYGIDTVYTDSKGTFYLKSQKHEFAYKKLYVELTDVDDEKNGSFTDMDVVADYSDEKFKGGNGNWYRGEAEKDLGIIKLTTQK